MSWMKWHSVLVGMTMKMLVTRPGDPRALEDRLLHAAPFPPGPYGLLPSPALRFSPPSPCAACLCSTNSDSVTCHWGWGLSLKRAAAPEPPFCKVCCVPEPQLQARPLSQTDQTTHSMAAATCPTARPMSAQRAMLPLPHHPPRPGESSPRLEIRTNLEDAWVGYTPWMLVWAAP